jgi:hypothetical protein
MQAPSEAKEKTQADAEVLACNDLAQKFVFNFCFFVAVIMLCFFFLFTLLSDSFYGDCNHRW